MFTTISPFSYNDDELVGAAIVDTVATLAGLKLASTSAAAGRGGANAGSIGEVTANNTIRNRVLANIQENRLAIKNSDFAIFSRRTTAKEFLITEGWSPGKINSILNGGGIDLSKPVVVKTFSTGTQVQQLVKAGRIGDWFGPLGQSADHSGLAYGMREPWAFQASQNVRVLESYAAPVVDTWTLGVNYPVNAAGGGIQWIPSNKYLFTPIQGPY